MCLALAYRPSVSIKTKPKRKKLRSCQHIYSWPHPLSSFSIRASSSRTIDNIRRGCSSWACILLVTGALSAFVSEQHSARVQTWLHSEYKMASSSMLSSSCVQTMAGLPLLGASQVKARISSPFLAGLELKHTQYVKSQQLRRTLIVSAKQDTDTPLVSPISMSTWTCTDSRILTCCFVFDFVNLEVLS